MEELVSTIRSNKPRRDKVLAALRMRWLGRDHPSSHLISMQYLMLLDGMSEKIDSVEALLLYVRLHGFSIHEGCLTSTTPPILTVVPHFELSIPTYFAPQEQEVCNYDCTVAFVPPYPMILTHDGQTNVDSRTLLVWEPGNKEYKLEGGERVIVVHGELVYKQQPTWTEDETLPVGVCYRGGVLVRENELVKCVGDCYIAWEATKIEVLRGALLTTVTWVTMDDDGWHKSTPIQLSTNGEYERINTLLLQELRDTIVFDLACYRIEDILWEGRYILDRCYVTKQDKDRIVSLANERVKKLDLASLLSVPLIQEAEKDYRLWSDARVRWNDISVI